MFPRFATNHENPSTIWPAWWSLYVESTNNDSIIVPLNSHCKVSPDILPLVRKRGPVLYFILLIVFPIPTNQHHLTFSFTRSLFSDFLETIFNTIMSPKDFKSLSSDVISFVASFSWSEPVILCKKKMFPFNVPTREEIGISQQKRHRRKASHLYRIRI